MKALDELELQENRNQQKAELNKVFFDDLPPFCSEFYNSPFIEQPATGLDERFRERLVQKEYVYMEVHESPGGLT